MAMQVMRSGRRWYGSWDLVAAVWAAITMLGLTIPFLVAQVGTTLNCQLNASCGGPSWLTPAAWFVWVLAVINAAIAVRMAAREAGTGQRRTFTRIAVLVTFVCAGFVLLSLVWIHGASPAD
jgi:hypothetical protein